MIDNKELGKIGEDITADFLKKHGYIIFKRNYHSIYGELDIVAEKDDLIVFVEVKTRFENALVSPAQAVNFEKQRRIRMTGKVFLSKTLDDYRCRFDVSEITVRVENGQYKYSINYIKNAFQ